MTSSFNTAGATNALAFFRRFLRNPRGVGAVLPSSTRLADAMLADVNLQSGDLVLEYGPGTGAFTRAIRERFGTGVRYLGIEREAEFVDILARREPHARVVHGQVEQVADYLAQHRLPAPKLIVSGLPLIIMPDPTMSRILRDAADILAPDGTFRTFSYVHSAPLPSARRLRRLFQEHFERHDVSSPVWRNAPPAVVLSGYRD